MELKTKRTDLLKSLAKVSGSIDKNIIIKSDENVSMSAANETISIMETFPGEVKKEGEICVEFSRLLNFTKNYSGEEVGLKTTKAGWMNIQGDNIKLRLPGIHKDNYPVVMFDDMPNKLEIDHNEIRNAINMTKFAIGQNKAREGLMGLNITSKEGNVIFTGADGFIISRYTIDSKTEDFNILIPQKTATEIEKVIDSDSIISYDDNKIQIESKSTKFRSKLMGATFPSLDRLLEKKSHQIKIPKQGLSDITNILLSISTSSEDPIVKLIFSNEKVKLESQKLDTGDGDGTIECDYSGEELTIALNLLMLKKAITAIDQAKDDSVIFGIDDHSHSITLGTESLDRYSAAIMPVKIQW